MGTTISEKVLTSVNCCASSKASMRPTHGSVNLPFLSKGMQQSRQLVREMHHIGWDLILLLDLPRS